MPARLILVGGFLGSGKTTLLWEAAQRLTRQGHSVGLITNDQAPDLVDTALLSRSGAGVREVSGSCFCCNFDGFTDAVKSLMRDEADVIIAEPVGSCTDLSATIMQPLKEKHPEIGLAPLTVLVDPGRVREVLRLAGSSMHTSALYILRCQMDEADRIVLNKADTLSDAERVSMLALLTEAFPDRKVRAVSALSGCGVDDWLDSVMADTNAGLRVVDVDYDRYAEGEAVLGWLNAVIEFESSVLPAGWGGFVHGFMQRLHTAFRRKGSEIGHVKIALTCNSREGTANLVRLGGDVALRGFEGMTGKRASMILNARVQAPPEDLEAIVRSEVARSEKEGVSANVAKLRCLMPGRPTPTHRYSRTI